MFCDTGFQRLLVCLWPSNWHHPPKWYVCLAINPSSKTVLSSKATGLQPCRRSHWHHAGTLWPLPITQTPLSHCSHGWPSASFSNFLPLDSSHITSPVKHPQLCGQPPSHHSSNAQRTRHHCRPAWCLHDAAQPKHEERGRLVWSQSDRSTHHPKHPKGTK